MYNPHNQNKDKKKLLMTGFIVFIMFGSVLGYALIYTDRNKTQTIEYNGYTFVKNNNFWVTYLNNQPFLFQYLPKELEDISFNAFPINKDKIYIAYDPLSQNITTFLLPFNKLTAVLTAFNIKTEKACINNKCDNLALVNCNSENPVIYFKNGAGQNAETKIYTDKNCIVLDGDINMAADRLNLAFLGVIK